MEANYVHKDSTTLVQDELVKNELLKENQQLKDRINKAVEYIEKCNLHRVFRNGN